MIGSEEKKEFLNSIIGFDRKIEEMHLHFQQYRLGEEKRLPDWETLEKALLRFSRRLTFPDVLISNRLDSVLHKFQIRKKK